MGDEDWDIADDFNALAMAVDLQLRLLLKKNELIELLLIDLFVQD